MRLYNSEGILLWAPDGLEDFMFIFEDDPADVCSDPIASVVMAMGCKRDEVLKERRMRWIAV